ncbi:Bug family tripartite tricarboxylate transporter substrate binding protein [Limnohabitans sp. Rim11]|uniref:Bug family tripartite tricarboxylate transporter substrate binding protein n=1 Tax=Limnohabitans sp. Rim11 TaxID=1100719 RepID=UPI000AEAD764
MNKTLSKRKFAQWTFSTIAATGLGMTTLGVAAQSWPTKPVKVVVPAPAGSSLDVIVRGMSETLKTRWGHALVVENKPGAGGTIGMDAVAKAAPDGYTLGIGFNGPVAFGPFMFKKMPYDPAKDLMPVVLTSSQPNVLAVPANHPAQNFKEFVAWAKSQGDKVSYASVGLGSSSHLSMELLKGAAGFEATHVPFNGSPPAALSVAQNETQALLAVEPALLSLVQGGRLKLLAVTSPQRLSARPDLPTVAEAGYAGFDALAWNGLFAPAGTPTDVIARINADVNAAMADPAFKQNMLKQGLIIGGGTPAAFKSFIDAETRKWGAIITKANIKLD